MDHPLIIDAATIADVDAARADAIARRDQAAIARADQCLLAALSANRGELAAARDCFERVMPLTHDPRLLFLGFQFFFRTAAAEADGAPTRARWLQIAEELVRRRLAVAGAAADGASVARAETNLGLVLHYQGRMTEAENWYLRSVASSRSAGDAPALVRALGNLGNYYETRRIPASADDFSMAEQLYHEALEVAETAGSPGLAASATANLGDLHATRADRAAAEEWWRRALALCGDAPGKVRSHCLARLGESA